MSGLSSSVATTKNKNANACVVLKLFYNMGYI